MTSCCCVAAVRRQAALPQGKPGCAKLSRAQHEQRCCRTLGGHDHHVERQAARTQTMQRHRANCTLVCTRAWPCTTNAGPGCGRGLTLWRVGGAQHAPLRGLQRTGAADLARLLKLRGDAGHHAHRADERQAGQHLHGRGGKGWHGRWPGRALPGCGLNMRCGAYSRRQHAARPGCKPLAALSGTTLVSRISAKEAQDGRLERQATRTPATASDVSTLCGGREARGHPPA